MYLKSRMVPVLYPMLVTLALVLAGGRCPLRGDTFRGMSGRKACAGNVAAPRQHVGHALQGLAGCCVDGKPGLSRRPALTLVG